MKVHQLYIKRAIGTIVTICSNVVLMYSDNEFFSKIRCLKVTFKNYEIKLNYQILTVGIPLEILARLP